MTDNPMPALKGLKARFVKEAEALGFNVDRAMIDPDLGTLEVVLSLTLGMFATDEQKAFDAQFEEMAKQTAIETRNTKINKASKKAKTELEDWLGKDD